MGVKGPLLPAAKRARGPGDQASHSLFSVLPKPSNDSSYRPAAQPSRSTFTKAPTLPSVTSITSGGGVTSMMPRTVKKAASATPTISASSSSKRSVVEQSGADDEDAPFFSFTDSSREKMDRELPKLPQNAMKSLASSGSTLTQTPPRQWTVRLRVWLQGHLRQDRVSLLCTVLPWGHLRTGREAATTTQTTSGQTAMRSRGCKAG